ncbi:MAG: TonB-dependent receptor [Bacteroidaceae bacterium]|nr:TonB-dependent receptor [Bacteroidaceae bacterium]
MNKIFRRFLMMSLVLCMMPLAMSAQNVIKGIVKDNNGEPIIGAAVIEVGNPNHGTVTNYDGNFELKNVTKDAIKVSYLGFVPQTITVKGKSFVNVILKEDTKSLDEIVVVGYGTMKRRDLTGSVASANLKDFEQSPNTNIVQSLQGTVPGLNVGVSGSAGDTPKMSIRGTNTINGNKDMLIILDGIIYDQDLSSLNPADIESIDILKDASSTAIYGTNAANGVMLITTKQGKEGKTKINLTTSYSFQSPTKDLHTMNRSKMLDWDRKASWQQAYTEESGYTLANPDFQLYTVMPDPYLVDENKNIIDTDYDWMDKFTRNGYIFDTKLSISGGTKDVLYLLSFGHVEQENHMVNDDFKRNTLRANVEGALNKWVRIGLQSSASLVNKDGLSPYLPFLEAFPPMAQPKDENGNWLDMPCAGAARENPYYTILASDKDRRNNFFANIYADVKLPIEGLTYRLNFGNVYTVADHNYSSEFSYSHNGNAYKNHNEYYSFTLDNILSYARTFGKHSINGTIVLGCNKKQYNWTNADANTFPRMTLSYNKLDLGQTQTISTGAWNQKAAYQVYRLGYNYDNRYLFTGTIRHDGSSTFAKGHRWGTFPSAAFGWVASEESFFKVKWVDYLKLRAGYGSIGNPAARYATKSQVQTGDGYTFGNDANVAKRQYVHKLGNTNLTWESTRGWNAGIDFTLFGNRLMGNIDAYLTNTKDLLYDVVMPTYTGSEGVPSNVGGIRNKGIELSLTSRNIVKSDFEWSTTLTFSANKNKITSLAGDKDLIASGLFIGKDLTTLYDFKIDGIYQIEDDIPTGYHAGAYRIVDMDNNGEVNDNDKTILGRTEPAYRAGLLNKFTYKDFTFTFFINTVQGGKHGYLGRNTDTKTFDNNTLRYNMISEKADLFWSPLNRDGYFALPTNGPKYTANRYQQRNFVRLQDVTLSYNLPKKYLSTVGLSSANVYVNAKNLITLTGWHGWDPELDGTQYNIGYGDRRAGSTYDDWPLMRSFTLGLNITF